MARQRWLTAFVPHRLELLLSAAWTARPIAVMRICERLEIEHLRHGGFENGRLFVSYGQFVHAGVSRRVIKPALECASSLGLIEIIDDQGEGGGCIRPPSRYRVTYLMVGKAAPTDEWKRITEERAKAIVGRFKGQTSASGKQSEILQEEGTSA